MVKNTSETEPVRNPITITVRATVPLMEYGNISLEATQEIDLADGDAVDRSIETLEGLKRLKRDLALVILPMVEADIVRAAPYALKADDPDYHMRKNSPVYRWLRTAEPDLEIPGMTALIASKSVPNSKLE